MIERPANLMTTPPRPIRKNSPIPLYVQIADQLLDDVRSAETGTSKKPLPSESELSERYKVSRVTIRQALSELESKGVIYREKGRGSFITQSRIKGFSGFRSFSEEVTKAGRKPGSKLLKLQLVDGLPEEFQEHFLSDKTIKTYYFLRRIRLIDDKPAALEDAYLPADLYPGLDAIDFTDRSLYQVFADEYGIIPMWADALMEAVPASYAAAGHLEVDMDSPLLVAWRVTLTETDDVIEYVKSIYSGSDFLFNVGRYRIG